MIEIGDKFQLKPRDESAFSLLRGRKLWTVIRVFNENWIEVKCKGMVIDVNLKKDPHFTVRKLNK